MDDVDAGIPERTGMGVIGLRCVGLPASTETARGVYRMLEAAD